MYGTRLTRASAAVSTAAAALDVDGARVADGLGAVGARVGRAQGGVRGFGGLERGMGAVGFRVARLADGAAGVLDAMRFVSGRVCADLEGVYELVGEGFVGVAGGVLRAGVEGVGGVVDDAAGLAEGFEAAAGEVEKVLVEAVKTRAVQEGRRKEIADSIAERCVNLQRARDAKQVAGMCFAEADRLYEEAVAKENVALFKGNVIQAAQIAAVLGSVVSARNPRLGLLGMGGVTALSATVDGQVARAREERAVHLRQKQVARDDKLEHTKDVAEISARLRATRREKSVSEGTLADLEDAITGLRELAAVMLRAEAFWRAVRMQCEGAGSAPLLNLIESATELPQDKRSALWASDHFRQTAVATHAQWVAMYNMCGDAVAAMKTTRTTLYSALVENNAEAAAVLTDTLQAQRGEHSAIAQPSRVQCLTLTPVTSEISDDGDSRGPDP